MTPVSARIVELLGAATTRLIAVTVAVTVRVLPAPEYEREHERRGDPLQERRREYTRFSPTHTASIRWYTVSVMLRGTEGIKRAVLDVQTRTQGVWIDQEDIRVGRDSTDDEAVWVYVIVPDDRIDEFYDEWTEVRRDITARIQKEIGNPEVFVYVRMKAASEVEASDS